MVEDQFGKSIAVRFASLVRHFNAYGWVEECPSESRWYFYKKGRRVTLNWFTGGVYYERMMLKV